MDASSYEVGTITEFKDQKYSIKVGDKVYEIDKLHGPVLVPEDLTMNDKVKVIIVNCGIRHIEKLTKEEETKMKSDVAPVPKKEIKKIPKKIKADQFFDVYDKGFQQKVYIYKVGGVESKTAAKKKVI